MVHVFVPRSRGSRPVTYQVEGDFDGAGGPSGQPNFHNPGGLSFIGTSVNESAWRKWRHPRIWTHVITGDPASVYLSASSFDQGPACVRVSAMDMSGAVAVSERISRPIACLGSASSGAFAAGIRGESPTGSTPQRTWKRADLVRLDTWTPHGQPCPQPTD